MNINSDHVSVKVAYFLCSIETVSVMENSDQFNDYSNFRLRDIVLHI